MFFNRRKKFNGDVAALLADFGIDVRTSPFAVLEVLDHAWLKRFNVNEGALLVAYSYAAGLYARDVAQADLFTMGRLYPAQLEWLASGLVRARIVEPMTRLLKQRVYKAYELSAREIGPDETPNRGISRARPSLTTVPAKTSRRPANFQPKPWILNLTTKQLIRRDSGLTFEPTSYYRDGTGYVVKRGRHPWAPDRDIEIIG